MLQLSVLEFFILETKALNQQYAHAFSAAPIHVNTMFKKNKITIIYWDELLTQTGGTFLLHFQSKHCSGSRLTVARQRRLWPLPL